MIKIDKAKAKKVWKWFTYTPIGLTLSFLGLFAENIFVARISPPVFEFVAEHCGDWSRSILRLPKPVECSFTPKNKPTNGEPFLYDVTVQIDFKHRKSASGLMVFRSAPHFFILKESVLTVEGSSLEKTFQDEAQKRVTGFEIKYQDENTSKNAKLQFTAQFSDRRRDEKCEDFLMLEH